MEGVGKQVRRLRKERGMSMLELSRTIGVSEAALCRFERGTVANFPWRAMVEFALVFGVSLDMLAFGDKRGNIHSNNKSGKG